MFNSQGSEEEDEDEDSIGDDIIANEEDLLHRYDHRHTHHHSVASYDQAYKSSSSEGGCCGCFRNLFGCEKCSNFSDLKSRLTNMTTSTLTSTQSITSSSLSSQSKQSKEEGESDVTSFSRLLRFAYALIPLILSLAISPSFQNVIAYSSSIAVLICFVYPSLASLLSIKRCMKAGMKILRASDDDFIPFQFLSTPYDYILSPTDDHISSSFLSHITRLFLHHLVSYFWFAYDFFRQIYLRFYEKFLIWWRFGCESLEEEDEANLQYRKSSIHGHLQLRDSSISTPLINPRMTAIHENDGFDMVSFYDTNSEISILLPISTHRSHHSLPTSSWLFFLTSHPPSNLEAILSSNLMNSPSSTTPLHQGHDVLNDEDRSYDDSFRPSFDYVDDIKPDHIKKWERVQGEYIKIIGPKMLLEHPFISITLCYFGIVCSVVILVMTILDEE